MIQCSYTTKNHKIHKLSISKPAYVGFVYLMVKQ